MALIADRRLLLEVGVTVDEKIREDETEVSIEMNNGKRCTAHIDHVIGSARGADIPRLLSNSFGMGGQNACVIFARPEELG